MTENALVQRQRAMFRALKNALEQYQRAVNDERGRLERDIANIEAKKQQGFREVEQRYRELQDRLYTLVPR